LKLVPAGDWMKLVPTGEWLVNMQFGVAQCHFIVVHHVQHALVRVVVQYAHEPIQFPILRVLIVYADTEYKQ